MKINFSPTVEGVPDGHIVEYYGEIEIDSDAYFVIYRPEGDREHKEWKAAIGSRDNLKEVGVRRAIRWKRCNGYNVTVSLSDGCFFSFGGFRNHPTAMVASFNNECLAKFDERSEESINFCVKVCGGACSGHP